MIQSVQRADLAELILFLEEVEGNVCRLDRGEDRSKKIQSSREALQSFCNLSACLGLVGLEQAGLSLESCLDREIAPNTNPESIYVFGFAISTLIDELKKASSNDHFSQINVDEVIQALQATASEDTIGTYEKNSDEDAIGEITGSIVEPKTLVFTKLDRIVKAMGGSLMLDMKDIGSFQLQFDADPAVVEQIEALLLPLDPDPEVMLAPELSQDDTRLQKILSIIKDFMKAFSKGDVTSSQSILLSLAEQQHQAGLYNEIGILARELHNSLKSFTEDLGPSLKDIVEHKIPDSGNRLEHILEITEKSANTTLDYVEEMQRRNQKDHERILQLSQILQGLHAVGAQARNRLEKCTQAVGDFSTSLVMTRDDLNVILTAQDYQDLTGQIIQKIITLLNDLELKLVNVVRAFSIKGESKQKPEGAELYGPAHKSMAKALHTQDDVDSLLAEFGF